VHEPHSPLEEIEPGSCRRLRATQMKAFLLSMGKIIRGSSESLSDAGDASDGAWLVLFRR
jgi:hypothetical protein